MKTWNKYLHILICIVFTTATYAQPANDACASATSITVGVGSCNSILYTNVAATTAGDPSIPSCWLPNSLSHTVWFSFVATTADIEVSTNFGGTLANTQLAVYSGACGSLTQIACQEDVNTAGGLFHANVILHGLTIGNTYYLLVDGNGNTTGTFGICAQETLPVGPTLPVQDCATAQTLCSVGNVSVSNGTGGVGTTAENPSCFGTPGERSSNWYTFTVATSGTLAFTITPTAVIDYDFAIFNTSTTCPGTELECNWSPNTGGSGITGLGCAGAQCENTFTVTAGQTYTILVDRYTSTSAAGFTLNFAGTTATFASPNPTFSNTTACIGTATQFTNTTNGNFTYNWTFGDGFTSNLENPSHTYAAAGSYTATLLLTAVPGGCQNAISHTVTVNPIPTVDAGIGGTVCSGGCITLGGSTNAVGSVGPSSFTNSGTYAIPDNSTTGVNSSITVSGISPTTIANGSINSVCINLTHTFDGDLDIFLRCPNGTIIELSTDNGGLGDNYTNTCFSTTAGTAITTGTSPFTGTYSPEQAFSLLNGCNANGTWQLFVQDDFGGDVGTIDNWTIEFNNNLPAYTWSPTTAMTNSTTLSPTVCPAIGTTYTLTANNGVGCTATDTVTVNVTPGPTATISYAGPFCTSLAVVQSVTLTGTGAYTGGVYSSTAGLTINPATGAITPSTSTPNTYTVSYTIAASGGCPAVVATTTVIIKLLPTATISYATPFCSSLATGQAVTLTGTGAYIGGVYSSTGGLTINPATGAITPSTSTPNTYTITYTIAASGGCASVVATAIITITSLPTASISYAGPFCTSLVSGQAVTLTGTGAYTGGVFSSTAGLTIDPVTGAVTPSTSTPNTYTVTYTIAASAGCSPVIATTTVTIAALPTAAISYATPFCSSLATGQPVTLTGTGAYTGGVYSSTAGLTINPATGAITPSTSTPNTYTVTYTIAANGGCAAVVVTTTVTINALPTATISYSGTPFCTSLVTAQPVTLTGTGAYSGGIYSSTAGLTINPATGAITPSTSTPNTYTVTYTITASGGCPAVVATTIVTITALPTAVISYGTPFCSSLATGQAVILTGTGAYTGGVYSSTAGLTIHPVTGAITPSTSTPNTYTVTYTVAANGGCTPVVATTTVTITALPTATINYAGTPFCSTLTTAQSVTLTGTGAYTGGVYSSTAGLTINPATGAIMPNTSTPNTYTVTYTIAAGAGCSPVITTTTVTITALPTAAISYATPFCSSLATGQPVTLTGTGAYTGGVYSSTAGLTINPATGAITPSTSTPSTYTVTYTIAASGGCAAVLATTTITINPIITPTINCGASTTTSVQFTWTAVTGANGYNVSYQVNANPTVTVGAIGNVLNYTVNSLTPGDTVAITLTPTGAAGTCFTFNTATCTAANCNPPTAIISYSGTPFCSSMATGQPVTLTGTGAYTGGVFSSTAGLTINPATGAITPSTSAPNSYTVTYTIAASTGCSPVIATTTVTITALPTAAISYATPFCSSLATGQAVTLTGTGAYTGGVYSSTAGLTINPATGAITPSTSTPNTYTVTYTVAANGGCAAVVATIIVTITALPTAVISYGTPFCSSMATAQPVTLTGTGAYTGGVYSSTAGLAIDPATGAITPSTSTPNTYTVSYIIAANGGCPAVVATTSVTITVLPTSAISYATPFCSSLATGQPVTLTGTGAYTGGVYSSTAGLTINPATGAITPSTSTPNTYTVTYTIAASGGCAAVVATTTVTITALPTAVISYATPFCSSIATGQPVTLTGTGAYTGGVYSSTAGLTINPATGAITPSTSAPNTYTVTYTIAATGGCPAVVATTSVTITALPTSAISYATPFCSSLATGQAVTLTGTGAYTGGVYSSTAGLTINPATGAITPSTSTPNTYTVTYTVTASGGCAAVVATTTVTINPIITPTINCGASTTTSVQFTWTAVTGANGYNVSYQVNVNPTVTVGAIGNVLNYTVNSLTPGDTVAITLTPTGAAGTCFTFNTATCTAANCNPPTAIISYSGTPFCSSMATGQPVTLTGTGAYTGGVFSSTAGLTIDPVTGAVTPSTSTPNTYTVTYTIAASAGCSPVIATTTVIIAALPTAAISYATPFCSSLATGQAVTLTGTGAYTGGVYSSTAELTINPATGAITPGTSTPNTYTVTYTIAANGGCAAVVVTTTITINALPTATISYSGTPFCTSLVTAQPVTLTGTGAYSGGIYSSTAGLTINPATGAITPSTSTPNTYTVTYTIAATGGCPAVVATTSVTITALPTSAISYATPFCSSLATGQAVTLTGTGAYTGGVYSSTAGLTINPVTGAITPSTSTPSTYTVTYTIAANGGCAAVVATTIVTITALPTAVISYGTPFCSSMATGQAVTLTGTGAYSGGVYSSTAGLAIDPATGAITPSTSTPNTYTVTYIIAAGGGCPAVLATTSVTITALPTSAISYATPFCSSLATGQAVTLTGTGAYTGGVYSSTAGLTINPATGAITPSTSTPNTYTVTYTVAANGGCAAVVATTIVTITALPTAVISYGTPFCSSMATAQPVTLTGTGAYTGGVFSSTAGLTIDPTTGAITPSTSTPNTYTVSYIIAANGGCPAVVATTSVTITALPTSAISYATPFCSSLATGQTVTLTGTGAYNGGVYSSTAGLTINPATGAITPSTSTPNTYTVTYTVAANGGCAAVVATTIVTITALPTAVISYGTPFCSSIATGQPVTLTGTGAYSGGVYSSTAGLTINPATGAITPSTSAPNTYTVSYIIAATGGCPAVVATTSVTITALPTAVISYATPFCSSLATGQPVTLTGTGAYTGGVYSSTAGLTINPATGAITSSTSTPNTYTVTYTVAANGGCAAVVATTIVTITALPTAVISYGTPFCSSMATAQPVTLTGTGAYSGGVFSSTAGLTIDPVTGAVTPSTSTPNTYTVTYTIAATGGCPAVVTNTMVTINPSVTPTFNAVAPICSGENLNPLPTISNNGVTGTWAPALNNTATTIYTFTPALGQCATTNTLSITVYSLPLINSINPLYYCDPNNDGFGVFDLTQVIPTLTGGILYLVSFHETLTDAQINGTTIPNPANYFNIHVDNQTIYIRVESTQSSTCYKIITLELIVNPIPEAIEPDDYHICDSNNDGYANFDLTTVASQVFGSINQSTHTIAYYTNLTDAQLATNPIGNLTNFTNQTINTQTIWIRVTNSITGCYDIVTLQLFVDPLPLATQPNYPPYTLCDNHAPVFYEEFDLGSKITDILIGQNGMNVTFHFSQADALANVNSLPLLYTNAAPNVQTLWIRVENANTGCFVLSTMDIRVEPLPSPIPQSQPYTICDGNQDGFGTFDLNTLTADILQGANYTITYHETIVDAQLGNNPLVSPYNNITPFVQIIYAAAVDNVNGCRSVIPIELNVNPQPITPFTVPNLIQCDEDSNPQNLSMAFDLTQNDAAVLTIQPLPPSNYNVTYYISQTAANAGVAPIIPATHYVGVNHEIIWVRVENNVSHCYSIGSFELLINPPLALTTPTPLSICDDDIIPNNQYTEFNLTVKNNEITGGLLNTTVTYYPSYPVTASSIAIPNPTAYTNVSPAVQSLGVMVTNAQGCRSYTSLDIRVLPIPTPRTTGIRPLPPQCDVNNTGDMLETFNLTLNASFIINGDPTLVLHYYPTQADALAGTNEILNPTAALVGENVWIRVENNRIDYLGNHCFVLVEQPLTVNPLPTIVQPLTIQSCDDDSDGQAPFDLTSANVSLLGSTQLPADFTITYYTTAANAQSGTNAIPNQTNFINATNPQIIFVRVVNNATACFITGQLTLVVNPKPTATTPAAFETCDVDGTNDGFFTLDLSSYINGVIGALSGVTTTFYNTQNDAINETNGITNLNNYQAFTHTVWIRVEDDVTGCYQLTSLAIVVEPLPEPHIASPSDTICVDYVTNVLLSGLTLDSGITGTGYTFEWSLGGTVIPGATGSTYTINTVAPGDYTVVATSTSPLACVSNVSNTFTVIQSGPAQFAEPPYTISNDFSDNQIIIVNVVGFGVYEYSLDDGPFQSSTIFEHASLGEHTITVRDVKGNTSCGEINISGVQAIDYPHFFTPNGDGIHDTWNVIGLEDQPFARLYIFDRYGKLLKQLSTTVGGWDGTYNDYMLPADDYWFKVEYLDQTKTKWKEFKSHFTLKR